MRLPGLMLLLAGAPGPLSIEMTGGTDPCGLQQRVPAALERWMSANLSRKPLQLSIAPRGGELLLTLVDDAGKTLLRRAVPNRPTACGATADGIALVIETYLRDLGWTVDDDTLPKAIRGTGDKPADPTTPPSSTSTGAADEGSLPPDEIEPLPLPLPSRPPPPSGVSMRLGARAVTEAVPQPTRIGGELTFRFIYDWLEFLLQVGALAQGAQTVSRGTDAIGQISFWSQHAVAGPGGCLRGGWGDLCGLARVGVERLTASASGEQLFQATGTSTLQLLTQAGINYSYSLGIFYLTAGADARSDPKGPHFRSKVGPISRLRGSPRLSR